MMQIGSSKAATIAEYNREKAKFFESIFTGKGQEDILLKYRMSENKEQKDQRKRLTKTRTKHLCSNIENIYDRLRVIDKAMVKISDEDVEQAVTDGHLEDKAFQWCKYFNMVDANAHVVFGEVDGKPKFRVVKSHQIEDAVYDYEDLIELVVKDGKHDLIIYKKDRIIALTKEKPADVEEVGTVTYNDKSYFATETPTERPYAFRLGFNKDVSTNFNSACTVLEPASELFVNLIWDGSELDIIKATHGVIRTYAYAEPCRHNYMKEGRHHSCDSGYVKCDGEIVSKCGGCNGSGMKIPTSSQDIIYFSEPLGNANEAVPLDKMVYQQTIDNSILTMRREDLEMLEQKILRTVFNGNQITQGEIQKTATEVMVDQEGIVSALGGLGDQISKCFVWMCHCLGDYYEVPLEGRVYYHGYSMDFSLDTIEMLLKQRSDAIAANVPKHVIDVIDYAILKKQHIDNPSYIDRLNVWEKFRPFSDKDQNERLAIIAMLPPDDPKKLLYYNFKEVRTEILEELGDRFYDMPYDKQKSEIYSRVLPDEGIIEDTKPGGGKGSREGNYLAQTVGGSTIVGMINEAVAEGKLTREGGIARAMIQLGYDEATATALVPEPPTSTPNEDLV